VKRAFNYTNRKPIPAAAVKVVVNDDTPDGIPTFDVDLTGLAGLGLDPDHHVILEPYVGVPSMRFECGTIGAPAVPPDRRLTDIDQGAGVRFRVLVIDKTTDPCRIVAAGVVSAGDEPDDEQKRSILRLNETAALGERAWKLDLQGDAIPELQINSKMPGFKSRLLNDPFVQALVLPAVVGELVGELLRGAADDECPWKVSWLSYAEGLAGRSSPDEEDDFDDFIEDCVQGFCDQHRFAHRVTEILKGNDDG
jgi:hypothetical protein